MKKKNTVVWNTRIKEKTSDLFQNSGASIDIDKRLYNEDIFASIVHTQMLIKQKIIPKKDGLKIINGLKKIKKEIDNKKFKFKEKFEDIHQNIEKRLFEIIGQSAGYLHTARSRNDQIITDFKIWIKSAIIKINKKLDIVLKTLLKISEKNIYTIMPGLLI